MSAKILNVTMSRRPSGAFTLTELLVSIVVIVIIVLMATQLMTSTTAITRTAHKHIDTDTQARVVFDRMALDFAQTVGGREKMETKAVTRLLSSARCPATIPLAILPARTVRFRSSLIGSTKAHRVGLPVAMADLNEWRRGCIGLGWMTTPQIDLTRLFLPQVK